MADIITQADDWSSVAGAWDSEVDEADEQTATITTTLLDRLSVELGDCVLELAAGPGSLGATWSELVGSSGSVLLSDLAPGMVEVARRRNSHLHNVVVDVIDAAAIDRPDASFDVVGSRMGLMFAPDPSAAFAEVRRVLAPGGRMAAATWAGLDHNPWVTCIGMAAMMTGLVSGGPPVGPGDIFSLGDPETLSALVEDAGFTDVTVEEIDVAFRAEDIEHHIDRVSSLAGPLAAILRTASPEQRSALRRTATDLAAQYVSDDGLEMPGRALIVAGRT